jgi:coenzyme F420-reducing hydrogenase delta subunit
LPPVQECCEFHSLDTAGNAKSQEQPVKVRFHRAPCHFELARDFIIVTALQEQLDDLLFALP